MGILFFLCFFIGIHTALTTSHADAPQHDRQLIEEIIRTTQPLASPRGERLPLYLWPTHNLGTQDSTEIEDLVRRLDQRGIAVIAHWIPDNPQALEQALLLGRVQQRLGLPASANATSCTYSLFNGDPRTAYIDAQGKPFFDASFGDQYKMGDPFSLDFRVPVIQARLETYLKAYRAQGLDLHFLFADWEIDGPIEWNGSWASAKRSPSVRARIPDIDDFRAYQKALRQERGRLQRLMFAEPAKKYYPQVLVGNYGVYPHNGYRYWYDYFETFVEGAPHQKEGGARYREWYPEFPLTGYTFAMPVVYTWQDLYAWYDFEPTDYRWFYNMLLTASNAGKHTPAQIPLIPFVHWHTIVIGDPVPNVQQFSEEKYRELLWHLLLRGHDTFFMWSPKNEALKESQLAHQVYAESHGYRDFLINGRPLSFAVPAQPGPVVSALRLGNRLLVRRTDFDDRRTPAFLDIDGRRIEVFPAPGCQLIELD